MTCMYVSYVGSDEGRNGHTVNCLLIIINVLYIHMILYLSLMYV